MNYIYELYEVLKINKFPDLSFLNPKTPKSRYM